MVGLSRRRFVMSPLGSSKDRRTGQFRRAFVPIVSSFSGGVVYATSKKFTLDSDGLARSSEMSSS